MDSDHLLDHQGEHLAAALRAERTGTPPHTWRCSEPLRTRVVDYARTCEADGEPHGAIALRLGIAQPTLSRWLREASVARFREVAIVPSPHPRPAPASSPLRLLTPAGYIVEGLSFEMMVRVLDLLG